ncbi:hypothetical protein Ct9H90mP29_18430 [bacterium]|nr:MAG: hypothetical protein Ct9H90mP29_18430 [bacterium]
MEEHRKINQLEEIVAIAEGVKASEHRRKQNLSVDIERRKLLISVEDTKKKEPEKWPRSKRRIKKRAVILPFFITFFS